jgi:hypothetical protein
MRLFLFSLLFSFFSLHTFAQSNFGFDSVRRGGITVNKDPRFDLLSEKQSEINKRANKYAGSGIRSGYRIQVINTQNRDEANAIKEEMLSRFPDQKAYLMYQAPNFRVRIGNFLTQRDASTLRKMIAKLYPQRGIYIVPDRIEYRPPFDEEDL